MTSKKCDVRLLFLGYTRAVPVTKLLDESQKKWDEITVKTVKSSGGSITVKISPRKKA